MKGWIIFSLILGEKQGHWLLSSVQGLLGRIIKEKTVKHPDWKGRSKSVLICRWYDPICSKSQGIKRQNTTANKKGYQSHKI